MWHGLGNAALAPVLLLTPLPCLIPWGVVLAVCLGFTPAFRLMSMQAFDMLPDELTLPLAPALTRARRMQFIELAFAGAITSIAALWTFGLLPEGSTVVYYATLVLWWMVAARSLCAQLNLGEQLADLLVDVEFAQTRRVARMRQGTTLAILVAMSGVIALACTNFGVLSADTAAHTVVAVLGVLLLGSAALLMGAIALGARGHAMFVAECVFESEALRMCDFMIAPADSDAPPIVEVVRAPAAKHTTRDEDDSPIPLSE